MKSVRVRGITIGEGIPKICAPIVGKTREEILEQAQKICSAPIDMVEWRADYFSDVFCRESLEEMLLMLREQLGNIPLLFTFRTKHEGGEKEIDLEEYCRMLSDVAACGYADLIDVEVFFDERLETFIADLRKQTLVIGSNHDFEKTPDKEELLRRLDRMQEMGVHICKIAVMPKDRMDVLTLLAATHEIKLREEQIPVVTMAMSELGLISRVGGEFFGSAITFGAVGESSAPGQIDATRLREMMEMLHLERR